MQKLINSAQRLNWALALCLALIAAVVFRSGWQEAGAIVWFVSLILLLPIARRAR